MTDPERAECLCGDTVALDGEEAMRRFGNVLCRDCADEPVVFVARCTGGFCGWSYRVEETEFNRGHAETRAQQEANHHERFKRVIDGDHFHTTEVEEVAKR